MRENFKGNKRRREEAKKKKKEEKIQKRLNRPADGAEPESVFPETTPDPAV